MITKEGALLCPHTDGRGIDFFFLLLLLSFSVFLTNRKRLLRLALDCELGLDRRDGRERKRGDSWETEQVNRIKVVSVCVCTEKGQIKPAARAYPTVTERETEEDERGNQER